MADVELAVQMIGLVEEGAGEEFLSGFLEDFSVNILGANSDFVGASDVLAEVGDAETSFTLRMLAFGVNDFGVDEDEFGLGVFFEGDVDNGDAASNADLRGSEADAVSGVHGLEHVFDKLFEIFVEEGDGLGRFLENRISEFYDGIDHRSLVVSISLVAGSSPESF